MATSVATPSPETPATPSPETPATPSPAGNPIPRPSKTGFQHYAERPASLTPEFVRQEFARLLTAVRQAEASANAQAWEQALLQWNSLKAFLGGEQSRRHFAVSQDARDTTAEEAERYFREQLAPVSDEASFELTQLLLKSRHREALQKRFGSYFFVRSEASQENTAPVNIELRVQEGQLIQSYSKCVAQGQVEIQGERKTLAQVAALLESSDASLRREAFEKHRRWFIENRATLAPIYAELVKLRDQMGKNLGKAGFIPLGYAAMERTDYGRPEVERFRESIAREIVPIVAKLRQAQAQELGEKTLRPWDAAYQPSLHMPQGLVPVARQLDAAQRFFDRLSPDFSAHFKRMREQGLIDLENRPGKRAGAFCTSFPDEARVAIFCNSTGSSQDIGTLIHEMGHALQAWESQGIELVDLRWPTLDAAELTSMGLEYLALRHLDVFFDAENARRFRLKKWKSSLELLCHVAVVDEFQHWVYENPSASEAERDLAWNRIFDRYQQGWDFTGIENLKPARWYAQGHIFQAPFYYIDYAIAETGALQLALLDSQDTARAQQAYLQLCRLGGTRSILGIFQAAGLRSPFEPTLMRDLAKLALQELELGSGS